MSRVAQKKVTKQEKPSPDSAPSLARECERLEELCHALEMRAEAAEQALRHTVSTVSHDLRNPLSVILVSSRMLLRALAQDSPGRKQIDAIVRAADEINQLAQDLVDASSIESGTMRVDREPQEIGPLLAKALEISGPIAAAKPIDLTSEVTPGLRPVACERDRVIQVLTTLINNAVRFTPRGGRVTVRAEPCTTAGSGPGVRFSIVDTGPGIPDDQRERVFARFAQARKPAGQVVGLAPYVAKGLVEAHGGAIWVEGQPGAGTTVCFTIPAAESAPNSVSAAAM
jgi:signal transduction histidine kinase